MNEIAYGKVLKSEKETIGLGKRFAEQAFEGMVVVLNGELGAGKTTFAKGFAVGLGVKQRITSPTFTILNCFDGRLKFYHFDFYRIKFVDELDDIGYAEIVYGDGVSLIEWGELLEEALPENRVEISFEIKERKSRNINVKAFGEKEADICRKAMERLNL